ncbi:hypothetical protein PIB30_097668 [Stylosanthes scabra]|uniref:Uncharacterized protein n=1 Tax=Stylosanthes scabra TaxID=79078 RepID=A0ABU6QVQ0_9FABA|nr:hypothetical protein [Stylosanthes scabra]
MCVESWISQEIPRFRKRKWLLMLFAIIWTTWRCRNLKVFENKPAPTNIGWCQLSAIVDQWKREKRKKNCRVLHRTNDEDLGEENWWLCSIFRDDLNAFVVGDISQILQEWYAAIWANWCKLRMRERPELKDCARWSNLGTKPF